jgi:hypothetical protein
MSAPHRIMGRTAQRQFVLPRARLTGPGLFPVLSAE